MSIFVGRTELEDEKVTLSELYMERVHRFLQEVKSAERDEEEMETVVESRTRRMSELVEKIRSADPDISEIYQEPYDRGRQHASEKHELDRLEF